MARPDTVVRIMEAPCKARECSTDSAPAVHESSTECPWAIQNGAQVSFCLNTEELDRCYNIGSSRLLVKYSACGVTTYTYTTSRSWAMSACINNVTSRCFSGNNLVFFRSS